MKTDELTSYLNSFLNCALFDDYGPNGIQIEGKKEIKKIGLSVSATHESIEQAVAWGADALIVHHGIFWKHQGAKPLTGPWGQRIQKCIKADLNLLAYHLPLDAHLEIGNAAALARALNFSQIQPFGLYKKQTLGVKASFSPIKVKDLSMILETKLNHKITLASPDENALIKSIGIITGGANNEWTHALTEGVDAYLTGEISEYNWHDAREAGIHYFAGGHHATERFGIQALGAKLSSEFGLEIKFFDSSNPA